jgi:GAF domain-containing protein
MVDHLLDRLERLTSIGVALSAEQNIDTLLEHILVAAKQITHADGGTLYTVSDDQRLQFAIVRNTTLGIALGGTTGQPVTFEPLRLHEDNGAANEHNVAAYAALRGETVNIADAYTEAGFDFSGTRKFDAKTGYRSQSFLTVPMKNHLGEVIGVLQLINALDAGGRVIAFSHEDQRFAEALASQAAIALTNRQLINQLE